MIPITQQQLELLKSSNSIAQELLRSLRIHGWPKVITTEVGKHFLTTNHDVK